MTNNTQNFDVFDNLVDDDQQSENSLQDDQNDRLSKNNLGFLDINTVMSQTKECSMDTEHDFNITKKQLAHNCTLESIVKQGLNPSDYNIDISQKIPNMAKKYPFELDDFQKAAILSIENNTSVLVAAHTSAGKTAVAEYVIAKCLQNNQRVIYTSPIKALSNQKYRDLKEEFGQVGLVTGDVTIEENQSCLVMTTEILRNMFFRANEIAKETAWIIFDEAHYLKDKDRGVIWEETIILAPKNVRYCLLSATAPNASELARWIMKVKDLNCMHVLYTDFRPVPLEYYALMSGDNKALLVKKSNGEMLNSNYQKLCSMTNEEGKKTNARSKGNAKDILNVVKLILNKKFAPAIIFAFSKKEVESLAKIISRHKQMLDENEKQNLVRLYNTLLRGLKQEDRELPQIVSLLEILKSGVGLHHGGMLPILKEIVEILFQGGLIKILISTETFSMGLNMPAKCVVFSTLRKWDGDIFRQLQGSEFVQMSGRAGRRGKDLKGQVIIMLDQNTEINKFWKMLTTQSKNDPLLSQFTISYNMLLNTLLMEGMEPEDMVKKSFKQFQYEIQSQKNKELFSRWIDTLKYIKETYFEGNNEKLEVMMQMIQIESQQKVVDLELNQILLVPQVILPYMNIGRLFFVEGCGWVPMLNISKPKGKLMIDFFVNLNLSRKKEVNEKVKCNCTSCIQKYQYDVLGEPQVISIEIEKIRKMSSIVVQIPSNLMAYQDKKILAETISKIIKDVNHEIPEMKLIEDIQIDNKELQEKATKFMEKQDNLKTVYQQIFIKYQEMVEKSYNHIIFEDVDTLELILSNDHEKQKYLFDNQPFNQLFQKLNFNGMNLQKSEIIEFEYNSFRLLWRFSEMIKDKLLSHDVTGLSVFNKQINLMKQVLFRLGFINKDDVPIEKGKIASVIFGTEELILTEILFSGELRKLTSKQLITLLTVFINEEKTKPDQPIVIKEEIMHEVFNKIKDIVQHITKVLIELEMPDFDEEQLLQKLNPNMFQVIQMWYDGKSFMDITKATDLYEGSLIRNIKRLYELVKQLIECADVIGNKDLKEKLKEGSSRIYRGIAFSASLYIEDSSNQ